MENITLNQFRAVAAEYSDNPCVVYGGVSLTYGELEARSNEAATQLQKAGVGAGSTVAICLERSPEFIASALAVWKCGAAYLPIDPAYPRARIEFTLADSGAVAVISEEGIHTLTGTCESPGVAYVIYTSGSTGQPKGVEVTHANLANLVAWHVAQFEITAADRGVFMASPAFDAAVWEIWPYLVSGAALHIPDSERRRSPELLRDWLVEEGVTIAFAATPVAEELLGLAWPKQSRLRTLLTGADTLHRFPGPEVPFDLVNNYGPTECSVVATSGRVCPVDRPASRPTIGKPIRGVEIHILNDNAQPVPAGEAGEIWIGGDGVARGYRNRPHLTAERFVNGRYRTGDRGRLLPNGEIEFLGRIDDQIKIRGYRIEPGEISFVLDRHPAIAASAIATDGENAAARLIAYLVPRNGIEPRLKDVHEFVVSELPEHLRPAVYVRLAALPLTFNGKVDRAQLPRPSHENTLRETAHGAARTETESQVCALVSELLGVPEVAVTDNFFLLGGHSLLGTQLIVRLREMFGVEIGLRTVFVNPTVAALAAEVDRATLAAIARLTPEEQRELLA